MFLHVAADEKFIDGAVGSFEKAAPGSNSLVVPGEGVLRHVRTSTARRLARRDLLSRPFIATLSEYDAVFLHSLNAHARSLVFHSPPGINFVWIGWGFDYYHLLASREELLLPRTREMLHRMESVPASTQPAAPAKTSTAALVQRLVGTPARLAFHRERRRLEPGGPKEWSVLDRIQHFAPVLPSEYLRLRERHPRFVPAFASWNYPLELAGAPPPRERTPRILVGNSATAECNHVDAFEWILANDLKGDVVCPLSYGDPAYREMVVARGQTLLGHRFIPIVTFMPPGDYERLIAEASMLVMNHVRQQGLGNILLALQSGTHVVIRDENPIGGFLADIGVPCAAFSTMGAAPKSSLHEPLDGALTSRVREVIATHFGVEQHPARTEALIRQCAPDSRHATPAASVGRTFDGRTRGG